MEFEKVLICAIASLIGGVATAVSGTGGLFTFPIYIILNIPPFFAQGTNKVMICFGLFQSSREMIKKRNIKKIILRTWFFPALICSAISAFFTLRLDPKLWVYLIASVIFAVTLFSFPRPKKVHIRKKNKISKYLIPFGFFYDGFAGPAIGAIYQMLFNRSYKTDKPNDYHLNLGSARVIHFGSALGASLVFIIVGKVYWNLVLILAIFNAIGHTLGVKIVMRSTKEQLEKTLFFLCLLSSSGLLIKLYISNF